MDNELPKIKIDERTDIEYHLEGDYYIPNIIAPKQEKITLNKYGKTRLKYLKEIQKTAQSRVEQIIDQLKAKSNLTEDMKNTDMLYWVGTMNSIKAQAEELVFNELICC